MELEVLTLHCAMAAKLSLLCLAAPALGLVARGPALPTYAARAGVAPMAMRTSVIGGNWCVPLRRWAGGWTR